MGFGSLNMNENAKMQVPSNFSALNNRKWNKQDLQM